MWSMFHTRWHFPFLFGESRRSGDGWIAMTGFTGQELELQRVQLGVWVVWKSVGAVLYGLAGGPGNLCIASLRGKREKSFLAPKELTGLIQDARPG